VPFTSPEEGFAKEPPPSGDVLRDGEGALLVGAEEIGVYGIDGAEATGIDVKSCGDSRKIVAVDDGVLLSGSVSTGVSAIAPAENEDIVAVESASVYGMSEAGGVEAMDEPDNGGVELMKMSDIRSCCSSSAATSAFGALSAVVSASCTRSDMNSVLAVVSCSGAAICADVSVVWSPMGVSPRSVGDVAC
jgi:hypothetical protein